MTIVLLPHRLTKALVTIRDNPRDINKIELSMMI